MNIPVIVILSMGLLLMTVTAIGLMRLPDFYARVHAVSKAETLGIALVLLALMIYEGLTLTSIKLGLIIAFVYLANPVAAHVLTRAAVRSGLRPWRRKVEASSDTGASA